MNFADHAPAHFHAWYNEYKVIVSIKDGIVKGDMFTEVVKAEYVDGYRIRLWFNNQMVKVVDLRSSLKGKVFEPLKNLNFFKRFAVKYNTIEWEYRMGERSRFRPRIPAFFTGSLNPPAKTHSFHTKFRTEPQNTSPYRGNIPITASRQI